MSPTVAQFTGGGLVGAPGRVGLQVPTGGLVPPVGPGEVVFVTATPAITLRCRLGATSATRKGGVGGWTDVERPGREAGVEWSGTPGSTLEIPLLFDGLMFRDSVEVDIAALYTMGCPPDGSPRGTAPPTVRINGMVPHGALNWVLTSIDEGEAVWDGRHRIRLWATVTFAKLVTLDLVKVTARKAGGTPATKVHVVRAGESLATIARDLMSANSSSEIAAGVRKLKSLNAIRDPKSLRTGQRIKVPR